MAKTTLVLDAGGVSRALHCLYAALIAVVVWGRLRSLQGTRLARSVWFSIGLCLCIDNVRYALADSVEESKACALSKLCFLSHEALTPLGLLFVPVIFERAGGLLSSSRLVALVVSLFFSYQGSMRFADMLAGPWKFEANAVGVELCRPSSHSLTALIPIFATVLLLMAGSAYQLFVSWRSRPLNASKKHDDGEDDKIVADSSDVKKQNVSMLLFVSQLVVFIGNGAIGPNKILMEMLGNGFEVLWLWSIGVALSGSGGGDAK